MTLLVVAALTEEVAHMPAGVDVLVTGVGKARATAALARRLADGPVPALVVNVGTAGALDDVVRGVVEIGYVTQHDFPYDAIEQLLGRDTFRGYALSSDAPPAPAVAPSAGATALATGDMFVADATVARRIAAAGIHLVDMEAFGYASACAEFEVTFRCVKAVSDSADESAGMSWLDGIDDCARALGAWVAELAEVRCHTSPG
ncbi:MAG: adenosylhomocysteine nucleosidase [Frankiaceae bacterium]|jgi:adenosylhomocysteine nucleosidase|nr:adenosylhomocysteine nucleosidase [Frankiaceae bacterium]